MEAPTPSPAANQFDIPELRTLILSHVPVDSASLDPALLRMSRAFCADLLPRFGRVLDLTSYGRRWAFVIACERQDALAPIVDHVRHLRIGVDDWKRLRPYKVHPDGSKDTTLNERLQAQLARFPCIRSNIVSVDMAVEPRSPETSYWSYTDEQLRNGAANDAILHDQRDVGETLGNEAGHVVAILERLRGLRTLCMTGEIDTRLCGAILCIAELPGPITLGVPAELVLNEPAFTDTALVTTVRLDATHLGTTTGEEPPLARSLMRWLLYNLRHNYELCRTMELGPGFASLIQQRSSVAQRRTFALAHALATEKEDALSVRVIFPAEIEDLGDCIAAGLAAQGLDGLIDSWRAENRV